MMTEKESNDIYYVVTLIEVISRKTKNHRGDIAKALGQEGIRRQLRLAEVNHCLSFEQVSDELIEEYAIPIGEFDTIAACRYEIPDAQAIGKDYLNLVEDIACDAEPIEETIEKVFTSFISDEISNFNSSVYYSNPSYLKMSYLEGELLD